MDRENLKDIFKSKARGANCLKRQKCKPIEPYAARKREKKKKKKWWQRRAKMLRIKSNIKQGLKLEEKREGAHEQACSEAQSTCADLSPGEVSASPTGCWLRQMEKPWAHPVHRGAERGTPSSPAGCLGQAPLCSQAGKLPFLLAPSRHWSCCLTHQTKCRVIIYHHKRNSRLLPNEGCSL